MTLELLLKCSHSKHSTSSKRTSEGRESVTSSRPDSGLRCASSGSKKFRKGLQRWRDLLNFKSLYVTHYANQWGFSREACSVRVSSSMKVRRCGVIMPVETSNTHLHDFQRGIFTRPIRLQCLYFHETRSSKGSSTWARIFVICVFLAPLRVIRLLKGPVLEFQAFSSTFRSSGATVRHVLSPKLTELDGRVPVAVSTPKGCLQTSRC